jgi:hypothetical protein
MYPTLPPSVLEGRMVYAKDEYKDRDFILNKQPRVVR